MTRDLQMKEPDGTSSTKVPPETRPPEGPMVRYYFGLCTLHSEWVGTDQAFEAVAQLDCDQHNEQCEVRGATVSSHFRPLDAV